MPLAGFEPTISAGERPQTYALDRAASYWDRQTPISKSSLVTGLEWPKSSRKLRFPDFMTTAQDGGKVVSRTHRPPKYSWYSFLLEAESTPGT